MLSTPVVTALVIIALVFSIVLGNIKKVNVGIIALACAWIIGCWLGGNFASAVTAMFPIKVVMYLICITFFYGFAISNGTMQKIGDKIMYLFRNKVMLIPFAIPLGAMIIAGAGGGGLMGDIVMVPIAIMLAQRIGMSKLLALCSVVMFAPVGGTTFWSVGGVASRGIAMNVIGPEASMSMIQGHSVAYFFVALSFYIILYIVLKGWKLDIKKVDMEKPEPMNSKQKLTLGLIITLIVLVVVPGFINIIAPNPICKYLVNYIFEIQVLCLIFGIVCALAGAADPADVIKNQIPWGLILVIGGVATLVGVAQMYGVTDMIAHAIGSNVSGNMAIVLMSAIGGIMSLVSDGLGVGLPTFYPMIPTIAEMPGAPMQAIFIAFTMGTWITAMSPLSSAGGLSLSLTGKENSEKLFLPQLIVAILYGAWLVVVAATGFFNFFG